YYALQAGPEKYDWFVKRINESNGGKKYYLLQSFSAFLATNRSTNTPETINMLADIARDNSLYFVRMAAFQALMGMSDKTEVKELLKEIRSQEKDKRLIDMYNRVL